MDTDIEPGELAARIAEHFSDHVPSRIPDDDVYGRAVDLTAQNAMQQDHRFVPPRKECSGWKEEGLLLMRDDDGLLAVLEGNHAETWPLSPEQEAAQATRDVLVGKIAQMMAEA